MSAIEVQNTASLLKVPYDGEIVISGITGKFPDSDNIKHLQENLMNKVDLISEDERRWPNKHSDIPQASGKLNNLEKFDASFFGVDFKQAHTMDPMLRILLEQAYEAVIDAGINPDQIQGSKTGVFIGACFAETQTLWLEDKLQINGIGIMGSNRAMLANRISHNMGLVGPSYNVDTACSSSLYAMEHAYRAIREGICDSALVGGANICLRPIVTLQFNRLGVLSPDGRCKSFDDAANGYGRSEAISVVFLQKAKDAKRVYATLVHSKTNCDGFKEQGITYPSSVIQAKLLEEFYKEVKLPPTILDYLEAHMTGTQVGDPMEIRAIDEILCTGRKKPLWIGSVKSNLGHAEPASGSCSIAKVVIAMETGLIPPNIHLKKLRQGVDALQKGRLRVVTEPTPWKGGYVGINSFGFGGANAHILLKSNPKEKINGGQPNDNLPRLVAVSGRTQEAVKTLLNDIESRPCDVEYVRLLHDIHSKNIKGHLYRGYTVLPPRGLVKNRFSEINNYSEEKKPLCFIFTGLGSQWSKMGEALLYLPAFFEAIKRCDGILKPHGINIFNVINSKNNAIFDNNLHWFVGTAAVQIGIVDVLQSVGIVPDYIIGHSMGELGCAYADGCVTTEQMILSAYLSGLAFTDIEMISGSMATVDLGFAELTKMLPSDIDIAYHNSADSTTISGPTISINNFVQKLSTNKIFVRKVPCNNTPYHSRYILPMAPKLLAYLQKVIPYPKARTTKWLSSSVPNEKWESAAARLSSAEYHTNSLLSQVLFEQTLHYIPKNAVTIEISPHGLLETILLRSLPASIINISLSPGGHSDGLEGFMEGLGKLYNIGLQPQLHQLYPHVAWPVSRSTPMISSLIKWDHLENWFVPTFDSEEKCSSSERTVKVTLADENFEYIAGHVIDGRNLFPATGYLVLIWETIGLMKNEPYSNVSVVFEDIKFLRATNVPKTGNIHLTLLIQKGSGRFEVIEGGACIVTGYVHSIDNPLENIINPEVIPVSDEEEIMTSRDIYKEFRLRGYNYIGLFRGIRWATINGSRGHIEWKNNWVAFIDNMLQMKLLSLDSRSLFVPTGISKLTIDSKKHMNYLNSKTDNEKLFPVIVNNTLNVIASGGVEIHCLKPSAIAQRKPPGKPVLESYQFIPYLDQAEITLRELAALTSHVALENQGGIKVKTVELLNDADQIPIESLLSPLITDVLAAMPLIQPDINVISDNNAILKEAKLPESLVIDDIKKLSKNYCALIAIGHKLLSRQHNFDLLLNSIVEGGFVLSRELTDEIKEIDELVKRKGLTIIMEKKSDKELFIFMRKRQRIPNTTVVVKVKNDEFGWVEKMKKVMSQQLDKGNIHTTRVIFVSQGNLESGLVGFINCLRREPGGEIARGFLIHNPKAPKFSLEDPFYAKELQKDMSMSVLDSKGQWGNYRHLPLPELLPKPVYHGWVNQNVRGDISSLTWLQGPIQIDCDTKNLLKVIYSSINFRDIMLAMGKLAAEVVAKTRQSLQCVLGLEFSGITNSGKRIMGIMENRAMSNFAIADKYLTWEVPAQWSLEDAATVPTVYATCYCALYIKGKMKKGNKVLIHSGSGGVGQAAITLALHEGCEVFTTIGTPQKRRFIRQHFPQIDDAHMGNSRDTSFEQMIMQQTNGKGVDIVLNSLAEEKLQASVRCLGKGGRFLEIGKFDLAANNPLSMEYFQREISFHGVLLDNIICGTEDEKRHLWNIVDNGLKKCTVKPLTRTVFLKNQIREAFRYMAAGNHIGKVLIQIQDEKQSRNELMIALPCFHCLENRSYIILGGLGGFGLELVDWLILRGAKNLVITTRTGIRTGYQKMRVMLWKSYGTKIVIVADKDASKREDCQAIIETAASLAPVDAIFNLAVVLKDAIWSNQTPEAFEESFRSKAWATKHFDLLSRKQCPKLRKFVVFSSVSCGRGNAGQSNYGMSNSVMERICERRVSEGLPGLAVQWGAVGDVGLVADMQEDKKELVIGGTLQQKISSCLQELNGFLCQELPVVSSMVVAEKIRGGGSTNIVSAVIDIMGLKDLKYVDVQTSLTELGMDSMTSVEIQQTLEREFGIFLTAEDIRSLNFAKLQKMMETGGNDTDECGDTINADGDTINVMKMLVRLLGSDDDFDSEVCIKLDTKAEKTRDCIFLIPGIEGAAVIFNELASKIKSTAYCLQLNATNNQSDTTISTTADKLLTHLLEKNKNCRNFQLVGYSFGSLIAIELVRRLEAQGLTGKLILIDGAPELMKKLVELKLNFSTEYELQNTILLGLIDIISPKLKAQFFKELNTLSKWEDKVDAFMSLLPESSTKMSKKYLKLSCTLLFRRMVSIISYDISDLTPLKTPITLLKPKNQTVSAISADYGLSKVTSEKVDIHYINGDHLTIMDSNNLASIINDEPLEDAK